MGAGRSVAIIGSGQVGLLTAHELVQLGYKVTVYSNRSAEDWLHRCSPTGSAVRFGDALEWERRLGLDYFERDAPDIQGAHVTFCPRAGNRLATLAGRFDRPAQAVDLRLQCHRWMNELEARGGSIEIADITVERLDEIAAEHELTIVAAGKGPLGRLFQRNPERSVYQSPQRNLVMLIVEGPNMGFDGIPYLPVKINLLAEHGEVFFSPYFHRDHGPAWNVLIEAKPGGALDRFTEVRTPNQALAHVKDIIRELLPWDWEWARDMEVADERGWLAGRVTPAVRAAVGRLPSGRVVTPLGDTSMSVDPVAGQGSNNGYRMARSLIQRIVAREDHDFDSQWMERSFEDFYRTTGSAANRFTNTLLEPLNRAGQELLIAQYGSDGTDTRDPGRQAIADAIAQNFCDPTSMTDLFHDVRAARRFIAKATGRPWWYAAIRGRMAIAKGQLRQALGMSPGHPKAEARPAQLPSAMPSGPVVTPELLGSAQKSRV